MNTEAETWLHYLWGMWSEKTTASKTDISHRGLEDMRVSPKDIQGFNREIQSIGDL